MTCLGGARKAVSLVFRLACARGGVLGRDGFWFSFKTTDDHNNIVTTTMAIQQQSTAMDTARQSPRRSKAAKADDATSAEAAKKQKQDQLILEHLPPLLLVLTILFCSGVMLVFSLRDFFTTGRNIGGEWDEAMLVGIL